MSTFHQSRMYLLDENISKKVLTALRTAGYKVSRVRDERLGSQPDTAIFIRARAGRMTIITFDTDYLDNTKFPPPHSGILVLRSFPRGNVNSMVAAAVLNAVNRLKDVDITDHVYVLRPDGLEKIS